MASKSSEEADPPEVEEAKADSVDSVMIYHPSALCNPRLRCQPYRVSDAKVGSSPAMDGGGSLLHFFDWFQEECRDFNRENSATREEFGIHATEVGDALEVENLVDR